MQHRLSWSQIREFFRDQWVELVDLEWDNEKPFPKSARVRNHSNLRDSLMSEVKKSSKVADSAIIFLGLSAPMVKHHEASTAH